LSQEAARQVYIVDDDDAVRDSMRALLESFGVTVRDFASARDFLAAPCKTPSGCMLLDLHMPEMSGVELLEFLRARGSTLPVIVMTGRSDRALKDRVMRAGAFSLFDKPVDEVMLMSTLDRAFASI
jgi:two-component system, LuxR family, response regulator FixJ